MTAVTPRPTRRQLVATPPGGATMTDPQPSGLAQHGPGRLRRRRAFAISLATVAAGAALAPQATAAPTVPNGTPFELLLEDPADLDNGQLGAVCPFPVLLSGVDAQRTHDNGGVVLLTGPAVVTVTNLKSGKSMTFNVSGPRLVHPQTGNITFVGQTLILQPTGFVPDDPFLKFIAGRVEQTAGNRIDNISGRTIDVCQALS